MKKRPTNQSKRNISLSKIVPELSRLLTLDRNQRKKKQENNIWVKKYLSVTLFFFVCMYTSIFCSFSDDGKSGNFNHKKGLRVLDHVISLLVYCFFSTLDKF